MRNIVQNLAYPPFCMSPIVTMDHGMVKCLHLCSGAEAAAGLVLILDGSGITIQWCVFRACIHLCRVAGRPRTTCMPSARRPAPRGLRRPSALPLLLSSTWVVDLPLPLAGLLWRPLACSDREDSRMGNNAVEVHTISRSHEYEHKLHTNGTKSFFTTAPLVACHKLRKRSCMPLQCISSVSRSFHIRISSYIGMELCSSMILWHNFVKASLVHSGQSPRNEQANT